MTTEVFKVWDAAGNLTFDSTVAVAGAALGFFTVAGGGSTWTFPDFTSNTGVALLANGNGIGFTYTTDSSLGYLRFIFPAITAGITVVLFAR